MRSQRNNWLTGMTHDEFLQVDPWKIVCHPESRQQWIAEVRSKLRASLSDDEILSILHIGLHKAVVSALKHHKDVEPHRRATFVIGAALAYIRCEGIGSVFEEIPGSTAINMGDLVSDLGPRSHSMESDYHFASAQFSEALEYAPQFLADGTLLPDETGQTCHRYIEQIRHRLTSREHHILRLAVIENQCSVSIAEILNLSNRQTWKVRRGLKRKLEDIAAEVGASTDFIRSVAGVAECSASQ
jgi:DNA-binding CsgD family transcriptional regulator